MVRSLCPLLYTYCPLIRNMLGLYGFDSRGPTSFPSMRMHYWSNVLRILRGKVGAEVIVTSVPGLDLFCFLHFLSLLILSLSELGPSNRVLPD